MEREASLASEEQGDQCSGTAAQHSAPSTDWADFSQAGIPAPAGTLPTPLNFEHFCTSTSLQLLHCAHYMATTNTLTSALHPLLTMLESGCRKRRAGGPNGGGAAEACSPGGRRGRRNGADA